MANETEALVTHVIPKASFLWSPIYGDVFLPLSRALALKTSGHAGSMADLVDVGSWVRVAVSQQAPKNSHDWVADARQIVSLEPDDKVFRLLCKSGPGRPFSMEFRGVGVVGVWRGDGGLIYNPRVGRILFQRDALVGGPSSKVPPPLVAVEFTARDRGSFANKEKDFIKFRALSVKPFNGLKPDFGVVAFRCLGRDAKIIGEGVLGFIEEKSLTTRIKAETWCVQGLDGGALDNLSEKAFLVYAFPRPYVADDIPGVPRPCEWEALIVKVDGKRPPSPISYPLPSRPTSSSFNLQDLSEVPPLLSNSTHVSESSNPFSPNTSFHDERNDLVDSQQSSMNGGNVDSLGEKIRLQTAIIDVAISDERIFEILSRICPDLVTQYLNLP